jgi:N-formylglutamate amidohydrolase
MPAQSYESVLLVDRLRGTLPVLLACGHDGSEQPEGVPARSEEGLPANCAFNPSRDLKVADLTRAVAEQLQERAGEAPYVVIAAFHRKYIDANRSEECAFEPGPAQPYYHEYHAVLRGFVDEIRAENDGIGLLLDLHGSRRRENAPADIYVGTENGKTISALRKSTGDDALYRRRGLVGLLQAAGYAMLPSRFGEREHRAFTGGYTVETYGSHHAAGIDAIQLEIVAELRTNAQCRARLATDLVNAIASLLPRWFPSPTRRPRALPRDRRDRRSDRSARCDD